MARTTAPRRPRGVVVQHGNPAIRVFHRHDHQLTINISARNVRSDTTELHLTPTEFDVLVALSEHPGHILSIEEITTAVWGEWFGPKDHLFVHIHHLRHKLGPCADMIQTKRAHGYLFDATPSPHNPNNRHPTTHLHFNTELHLVALNPHAPFLGWNPNEVLWRPIDFLGTPTNVVGRLLQVLADNGISKAPGPSALLNSDGQWAQVQTIVRLTWEQKPSGRHIQGFRMAVRETTPPATDKDPAVPASGGTREQPDPHHT